MTDIHDLLRDYAAGPSLLRQAIAGMPADQLVARPIPGKMSTLDVVCHITDFEIVYADRMKRILVEDEPTMFGGDPDQFAEKLYYDRRDAEEELAVIDMLRQHMVRLLGEVPAADFQRTGRHTVDGLLTLQTLLQRITNHVPHHIRFIEEKRRVLESAIV